MSKQKLLDAKELIQQKRYEEARAILKTVDHPTAKDWLNKLEKIAPEIGDPFADMETIKQTNALSMSKGQVVAKVGRLEGEVSSIETKLRLMEDEIKNRAGQRNSATIVFIFCLLLSPIGIGIVLLPLALFNYFRHKRAVNKLQEQKQELLFTLDGTRSELGKARAQLY